MSFKNQIKSGFTVIWLLLFVLSCADKKCQKPPTEAFKSITESEWRLTETNDPNPNFKKLNNTTFFIFSFQKNYTGAINNVINNDKFDTPVRVFKYNISPSENLIRIKYDIPTTETPNSTNDNATQETPADTSPPIDYSYELKRELMLTNLSSGAFYRFVPFTGIVDPDNQCTF